MVTARDALRRRWIPIALTTALAVVGAGVFQLYRPATHVAVGWVDIGPTIVSDSAEIAAGTAHSEVGYVTAPEVIDSVAGAMTLPWEDVRTVKVTAHQTQLRIAVSSTDPAVATQAAEQLGAAYAEFRDGRVRSTAAAQQQVLGASIQRLTEDVVQTNEALADLSSDDAALDGANARLATLLAEREVALGLLLQLQQREALLGAVGTSVIADVAPAVASPATLGYTRLAFFGLLVLTAASAAAVLAERVGEARLRRRERHAIDLRRAAIIDLRDGASALAEERDPLL